MKFRIKQTELIDGSKIYRIQARFLFCWSDMRSNRPNISYCFLDLNNAIERLKELRCGEVKKVEILDF